MNYHCWRDVKTKVNEDVESAWPKLSDQTTQERSHRRSLVQTRGSQLHALIGTTEDEDAPDRLDEIDYPKLGGDSFKRKCNAVPCNQIAVVDHFRDRVERRLRMPRSTKFISINLQKTLEKRNWDVPLLTNQGTKITVDICKLNVNMSFVSPLERWLFSKPKRRIVPIGKNKKKMSRLKGLILYERSLKKRPNDGRICELTLNAGPNQDTSGLDFNNLRINVVSQDHAELLKKMSALSCLSTNYRNSVEIDIDEDKVIFRPDLNEKMENMSIEGGNVLNLSDYGNTLRNTGVPDFIDSETMNATANLKICEDTVESIDGTRVKVESNGIKFTKKFREYCTNTVTSNLTAHLETFLAEISRLQKKMYSRDSVKGKHKRRYHAGIKEAQKQIDLKRIKMVIIATDLEKSEIEGGLDDTLNKLVATCKRHDVPYCFGLGRRKLGYYSHGSGFVSCIGIANYSGAEEMLKNVLLSVVEARNEFSRIMSNEGKTIDVEKLLPKEELLLSEVVNAYLRIIASTS